MYRMWGESGRGGGLISEEFLGPLISFFAVEGLREQGY